MGVSFSEEHDITIIEAIRIINKRFIERTINPPEIYQKSI
jgi:hypothetical protein